MPWYWMSRLEFLFHTHFSITAPDFLVPRKIMYEFVVALVLMRGPALVAANFARTVFCLSTLKRQISAYCHTFLENCYVLDL